MKRTIVLFFVLVFATLMISCGGPSGSTSSSESEEPVQIVVTSYDELEEALGLSDGIEQLYQIIGASYGKAYFDGEIEMYEYDSEGNKNLTDAINSDIFDTFEIYQNGRVFIAVEEGTGHEDVIETFKSLKII